MPNHYRIENWDSFEHPTKSKRPDGPCPWFAHPSNLSSKGRLRLLRMGAPGCIALVVFEGICALHASWGRDRRTGDLLHSDGSPLDIEDIADAIRMSDEDVASALELLSSDRIGWLRTEAGPSPVQDRTDAGPTPDPKGSLQDRTGQDFPPNPPPGGESGSAGAEGEGREAETRNSRLSDARPESGYEAGVDGGSDPIPPAVLDAWDASGLPPAQRPPDQQTVRAYHRNGSPSAEEVGRRARLAAGSKRYRDPDPPLEPLGFSRAMRKCWPDLGELTGPPTPAVRDGPSDFERDMAEAERNAAPPEVALAALSRIGRKEG